MLNQIVLVGRITKDPELIESETGKKLTNLVLAVPRSYKNKDGEYETDFIPCTLWTGVAEKTTEYCKKGDLVGVRGSLKSETYEKDGKKQFKIIVNAEKVTFLQSKDNREPSKDQNNHEDR